MKRRLSAPLWIVPSGAVAVIALTVAVALYAGISSHSSSLPDPSQIASACAGVFIEGGVHWVTLVALFTVTILATASVGVGSYRAARRWRRQRSLLALATGEAPPETLRCSSSASHVQTVLSEELLAFTWGIVRPRIYVSKGLIDALTPDELTAVLSHEEAHRCRRDPLKRLLLTVLSDTLFYMPVVGRISRRLIALQEIQADRAVWVRAPSRRGPLARALAKLIDAPAAPGIGAGPAPADEEAWSRRIDALVSGTDPEPRVGPRDLRAIAMGLLPALIVLAVAIEPLTALHWTPSCA